MGKRSGKKKFENFSLNPNPNPNHTNMAFSSNGAEIYVQTEFQVISPGSMNPWDATFMWQKET